MRCQSNQSRIMRDKNQILKHLLPPLPSSWAQLPSRFPYLLSLNSRGGWGMGVAVSSSHAVSAAPTSSGGGLLTLFPCSRVGSVWVGSLRWEAVLHNLLQCGSFPQHAVLHKLLQCRSCPEGAVLQEQAAPVWISCGVLSPASKPAPAWAPLSPQGHRSCQEPAPVWASHGITAFFGHPPALVWGPFHGLQMDICSTMNLHGLQGDRLPHHGLLHRLQGNLSSGTWSTSSSPPSSLTLVSAELFLSHSLTPLSCCTYCYTGRFSPQLKYVMPEVLPPSLMGLASASSGSVLEPAGITIGHGGSFWQLYTEATRVAFLLPKPCYANPIHYCNFYILRSSFFLSLFTYHSNRMMVYLDLQCNPLLNDLNYLGQERCHLPWHRR